MVARKANNLEVAGSNPASPHYRGQLYQILYESKKIILGRIAGIEPASSPWQREIFPFDHIRIFSY